MTELLLRIAVFDGVVLLLLALLLLARRLLAPQGRVRVAVPGREPIAASLGRKLLAVLTESGIAIPAACGGRGTCGLCRVVVERPREPATAVERSFFSTAELEQGWRLACQLTLRGDLVVRVPEATVAARRCVARVRSSRSVTPWIKEIVLELPRAHPFAFRAGSFVQVTAPPFRMAVDEALVDPPQRAAFAEGLHADARHSRLVAACDQPTTRAYSLANPPSERGIARLAVRIALPPRDADPAAPAGTVSSWLFARKPGDPIELAGPYGHFFARESGREMVFVGGGAGMAPMRAHLREQLLDRAATRTISFWYGARSRRDLFWVEEFDQLARDHGNFRWSVALSEPRPEDGWQGATGFIHEHLRDAYLARHPAPGRCEYYLCGPPLMIAAMRALLDSLRVDPADVFFDDFGS